MQTKLNRQILLFLFCCFQGVSALEISFNQLAEIPYPQHVVARGFLYQSKDGSWILAAQPNLKSCCTGTQRCIEKQIYIKGNIPQPQSGRVYTVEGIFSIEPIFNDAEELIQLYHLKDAKIK